LEKEVRSDTDIRRAVREWREDPAAAERRYGHISDWDVSRVTNMSRLFCVVDEDGEWEDEDAEIIEDQFNEDLSKWQIGNVKNMSWMFKDASSFTSDLSKWQTGNVTDMSAMFFGASAFDSDLSIWQTSNVRNMSAMFSGATSLQERPSWYTR
jgi:surface protein